jgi:hypothetical protein
MLYFGVRLIVMPKAPSRPASKAAVATQVAVGGVKWCGQKRVVSTNLPPEPPPFIPPHALAIAAGPR